HIFDISNPDTIKYVKGIGVSGVAWDIVISGNLAYVATSDGLQIFDISIPTQPQPLGYVDTLTFSLSSAVVGNYCYVADFVNMVVVDISSPTNPYIAGQFETGYFAEAVAVSGNYAYVAEGFAGLWILDISTPSQPKAVGHFKTEGYVNDVVVSKNIAYLAKGQYGIEIVDVSESSKPISVVQIRGIGALVLLIREDKLFVAAGGGGMVIFDVTSPANPRKLSQLPTGAVDIDVFGNIAYNAGESGGLFIVDISDPENPFVLSNYFPDGFVTQVVVSENLVFINFLPRTGAGLVRALNASDPRNLMELFSLPGYATALAVQNHFLIVGLGNNEIKLLNVTEPSLPQEIARYRTGNSLAAFHTLGNGTGGISTDGRFIYWAFGFNGLYILDASKVTSVSVNPSEDKNDLVQKYKVFQSYPNPFNAETVIEYELPEPGQVVMKVYNLVGKEVATLV
ncbi:MAG: LVIVD repeat-containing protein, partial [Nitrososphaera sp.]